MFSFMLAFVLFIFTLPLNVAKVSMQAFTLANKAKGTVTGNDTTKRDTALSKIKEKRDKRKKFIENTVKVMKVALQALKTLLLFLRTIVMFLISLGSVTTLLTLVIAVALIAAAASVSVLLANGDLAFTEQVGGNVANMSDEERQKYAQTPLGTYSFNASASVQEVINMPESEIWALISDGRFNSFDSACAAAYACEQQKAIDDANGVEHVGINPDIGCEKVFWQNQLVTITVPRWEWEDSAKEAKKQGTVTFNVNKNLAEYWTSYLTDLFNCSDQFVIVMKGDFNFRQKSSTTKEGDYSAHSFGTAIDINWESEGMGAVTLSGGKNAVPFLDYSGLTIAKRSEACAFNSSWCELVKQYQLDWGGFWSAKSLDPTHFSLVGDRKKDGRSYNPQVDGKTEIEY